jgi:hypothetical protein
LEPNKVLHHPDPILGNACAFLINADLRTQSRSGLCQILPGFQPGNEATSGGANPETERNFLMQDFTPVTVSRRSTLEERQIALMQIYRQVLERIPYEAERRSIAKLEQDFLKDKIGVRRFLKALGCSDLYLETFYFPNSNFKFLDLCFKHFMGRAPLNQEELRHYDDILVKQGVKALIPAIMDSEEYRKAFGCFTVPYPREYNYYESPEVFLESRILNEEHIGQSDRAISIRHWKQLGMDEQPQPRRHPEADEVLEPSGVEGMSADELLGMLRSSSAARAKEVINSLSPAQKAALRQALS